MTADDLIEIESKIIKLKICKTVLYIVKKCFKYIFIITILLLNMQNLTKLKLKCLRRIKRSLNLKSCTKNVKECTIKISLFVKKNLLVHIKMSHCL